MNTLRAVSLGRPFTPIACICSREIPLADLGQGAVPEDVWCAYAQRMHEGSEPPEQRLYCADCGEYIWIDRPGRTGMCYECNRRTCKMCGRRSHMFPCKEGTEFRQPGGKVGDWLAGVRIGVAVSEMEEGDMDEDSMDLEI